MIDIHTHILPNIDDGAKSVNESIEMLVDSYKQGVTHCVLTPHCVIHSENAIEDFLIRRERSYQILRERICTYENIPKIFCGAEVYCDHDISKYEDIFKLCIGKTNYMLIEFPITKRKKIFTDWVYSLRMKDIKVIIAHIERYPNYNDIITDLEGLDIIYQINASNIINLGKRKIVKQIIKQNESFIVASDMHNMTSRRCKMQKAKGIAKKKHWEKELFREEELNG